MENIGFVVCARVQSSRIHEKVLQRIKGQYTIEILLDHICQNRYPVVLAIPESKDCDVLEDIALEKGVECYRGEDESPLHRLYKCAEQFGFDYVVRITADDILIDLSLLYNQIKFAMRGEWDKDKRKYVPHDYTYLRRCPEGVAAEVINVDVLKDVIKKVGDKPIEFISYYIKGNYKTKEYFPPREYQSPYRLTMDYPEDLMLLRILFASLPSGFGTLDFLNFLHQHKYFLQINRLPSITIYTCNYNSSKYIVDTMKSVYSQDFEDFEYIIMDDCSSDDSMKTIAEYFTSLPNYYQEKTKIYRNEKNIGLPSCCNKVLEMARGRFIIRVDSDDILEPEALSKMLETIKIEDVQGVLSAYHVVDEFDNIIEVEKKNKLHPACCLLSTWATNEIKYRDGLKYMEGKPFFDEFNKKYEMKFLDKPLWNYRQHSESKTAQKDHPNNDS